MSKWNHRPQYGEKFNDKSRGPYRSNGIIHAIHWSDQEIVVMFWTQGDEVEYADYSFDDIHGCWREYCGGVWVIVEVEPDWLTPFLIEQGLL